MKQVAVALFLATILPACGNNEVDTEQDTKAVTAEAPQKQRPKTKPKARPKKDSLPDLSPETPLSRIKGVAVSEDLESEAGRTVKIENLDAELDRLEVEILGEVK